MVEASEKAMFFKWQCDQQHQGLQPNGSKWDEQKRQDFHPKMRSMQQMYGRIFPQKPHSDITGHGNHPQIGLTSDIFRLVNFCSSARCNRYIQNC
jgi:hypothetical protein